MVAPRFQDLPQAVWILCVLTTTFFTSDHGVWEARIKRVFQEHYSCVSGFNTFRRQLKARWIFELNLQNPARLWHSNAFLAVRSYCHKNRVVMTFPVKIAWRRERKGYSFIYRMWRQLHDIDIAAWRWHPGFLNLPPRCRSIGKMNFESSFSTCGLWRALKLCLLPCLRSMILTSQNLWRSKHRCYPRTSIFSLRYDISHRRICDGFGHAFMWFF